LCNSFVDGSQAFLHTARIFLTKSSGTTIDLIVFESMS
jgi:hypothetical protein